MGRLHPHLAARDHFADETPVAQYPAVAPPSISITANYAGASAETLADTVTSVIEQQLNGIDNLLYMSSASDANGTAIITLYFKPGTNADVAQVQVQNKVQLATPSLPQTVQQQGVVVAKATRNFMMFIALSTDDGSMDAIALGNYLASNVLDPIRRVQGVGEVIQFGTQYAMRVWLDPDKLLSYNLTPSDISAAIAAQNTQVPVGQIGQLPAVPGQQLNVILQGRATLREAEEFKNIVLRVNTNGSRVYLHDVARVELGGQDYTIKARIDGKPTAAAAVKLSPTANALDTAEGVRNEVDRLKEFFPPGVKVIYPLDTSTFVKISVEEVLKTLVEAIILVFLVMYLFLQNFRATLIPTLVVPVALLGTCGLMAAFGFSINVLTMFGMVLAIGILVDDAIVVVENIVRHMRLPGAEKKSLGDIALAAVEHLDPVGSGDLVVATQTGHFVSLQGGRDTVRVQHVIARSASAVAGDGEGVGVLVGVAVVPVPAIPTAHHQERLVATKRAAFRVSTPLRPLN